MNIFKAIGQVLGSLTRTLVKAGDVVETALDATHDVAHMAKETTSAMRAEMAEENRQALAQLKAKSKESKDEK